MAITFIGYGTRGDVQPYLNLAFELQRRGHGVRVVAPRNFQGWVEAAGVPFMPLPSDTPAMMGGEEAKRMLAAGDILSFFRWLAREEQALEPAFSRAIAAAAEGASLLVSHPLVEDRVAAVGAARRLPVLPVYFYPVFATCAAG